MSKLSEAKIKALKPAEKLYRVADGHGLALEVTPNGSKLWRYRYRSPEGNANMLSFGAYPIVTLAQARERVLELRKQGADSDVFLAAARKYARTMTHQQATELLRELQRANPLAFAWAQQTLAAERAGMDEPLAALQRQHEELTATLAPVLRRRDARPPSNDDRAQPKKLSKHGARSKGQRRKAQHADA